MKKIKVCKFVFLQIIISGDEEALAVIHCLLALAIKAGTKSKATHTHTFIDTTFLRLCVFFRLYLEIDLALDYSFKS